MKVGIINYGMGNLGSVRRAFEDLDVDAIVAEHPSRLFDVNRIVLPGVGAFGVGMERLRSGGWVDALQRAVIEDGRPMLGICLGMQMLASTGEENGITDGLGFVPGRVRRLDVLGCSLRIPHVGWNEVSHADGTSLFRSIPQSMDFYFVHSYALEAEHSADVIASCCYGVPVAAAVQRGNVFGTQFHPEKSSKAGRQVLKNYLEFLTC